MGALGKRKPAAGKKPSAKAAKREPSPEPASESESEDGSSGDDDDEDEAGGGAEESNSGDGSDSEEALGEDDASDDDDDDDDDDDASADDLDDEAFEGDDVDLDDDDDEDEGEEEEEDDDAEDSDGAMDDDFDGDDAGEAAGSDSEDSRQEEYDDAARAAAAAASRAGGGGGFGFAKAFANLVGDDPSREAEVLPKTKKQRRVEAEARREKRARNAEKSRKLELRERGHVVPKKGVADPASDQLERRLIQTATRGVVRLFNAVSKAQRDAAEADASRDKKKKKTTLLSSKGFMAELTKRTKARTDDEIEMEAEILKKTAGQKKAEAEGGWDVLSDGYLMGRNKMKDWEKGTAAGENELEIEDEMLE
ncbi:uncharacterized protein MICPUCDRAFT_43396 [Micromonas pusilla CCMP1545]|uniref:Predicted protein n=2 Tax=Micromonas pusilla TaxID=38833 RepID=C1N8Q9_MICPC|nr:uncharacterized protein MICPUCDRAFT_43396 [Micromonas pusilla CCMP1545]EEH51223.1 predicted protein [Micromonas pusilla CCMP1545]|eukprot:XP_003064318.1 predicted protein [Micromonas pusilla CCMP1545]